MSKIQQTAQQIAELVGGKENINSATHCVTRLRLSLKDASLVDQEALEALEMVQGCFEAGGQYQVIIGPGLVDKVYAAFIIETGVADVSKAEMKAEIAAKGNKFQRLIRLLADIFIPILPAIVASGLLMGVNNILSNPGIFFEGMSLLEVYPGWEGFAGIVNLIANTSFTFLPALVGWSAVKKFGGNPLLGIVLGLILVHPNLMSAYDYAADPVAAPTWNLLGMEIAQVGYQGQVIPVLIGAFMLAKFELTLKRFIPDALQLILVAPVALLMTGIIMFVVVGPITMAGANLITEGILALFDFSPALAGAVYGLISPPLVITGMHHLFLGVNLQMAGTLGYVTLWPIGETATLAQGAACLTMYFLLRNQTKMRGVALASTLSAWLGITEPAIYGVNLRYRYPFIAVMLASATGSAFLAYNGIKATSVGVGGVFSFLSVFQEQWGIYFIGMGITFVATVVLTLVLSRTKLNKN